MARYRAYRGRGHRGISVLVILVLVLMAAVLIIFVLPDYLVYTAQGVRLDIPVFGWGSSPSSSRQAEVSPSVSLNLIIDTPPSVPSTTPSPTPAAPSKPRSIGIPLGFLKETEKLKLLKDFALAVGISDIVIEIKDANGEIAESGLLGDAMELFGDPSLTLTARISAFKDNKITRTNEGKTYGVKHSSGVNWLDNVGGRYINPYIPEARQFVIDCVLRARDAGFDRVLLDDVHFPYYGSLSKINYGENATISHMSALNIFLDELGDQADGLILAAVLLEDTVSSGRHPEAGQELSKFKDVFDELYYYVPDDMSGLLDEGIPIFSALSGELRQRLRQAEDTGYLVLSDNGEFSLGAFER